MDNQSVGLIGLGSIGTGMAQQLLKDGLQVIGYDLNDSARQQAAKIGVTIAESAAGVVEHVDQVLLSLPDSDAVEQVCLGSNGLLVGAQSSANRQLLVIDTTSGYPGQTQQISQVLEDAGIEYIDAAITAPSGGANGVGERQLTFIVGGAEGTVDKARPLLERLGDQLFHVGPVGSGQIVKQVNNMSAAVSLIGTLEGLLVASKHGLDLKQNLEVMRVGTGHTAFARFPQMFDNRNHGGAHIGLMTKDLEYMSRLAREARIPSPVGDLAGHQFRAAAQTLGHDASILQIADVMETWSGVTLDFDHKVSLETDNDQPVDSITKVGIIGLGNIGEELCKILIKDGLDVYGHDVDGDKIERMAAIGVKTPGSVKAIAEVTGLLILALPQSAVVEHVLFDDDGAAAADNPGLLIVDTTSGYPDQTREFAQRLAGSEMILMDAAITGERGGSLAIPDRNLTFIVGGEAADLKRARTVLDRFSSHLFLLGPLGAGQIAKMVNNMVCSVAGVALLEG
ncbi:MAG: NAD(P)-dependent oxidoreductase, partial [Immundisolibacteraceae bacterium]|nr:NAD(P)-dependent oxidoreductase [Immundisolibacteraceae bacterium]